MKRKLVMCALVACIVVPLAAGAASARPVKIGFAGGASVPISDAKDALKTGYHGKAMVMWTPPVLPLALRASVGYQRLSLKSLAPGTSGHGQIISGVGNVSYGFPVGPVKPYLIAGLGAFNVKADMGGTGSSPSETKFGIDAGAGMEFKLGGISGFVEGKYENIFTDQGFSSGVSSSQSLKTQIIPVTFGIFF